MGGTVEMAEQPIHRVSLGPFRMGATPVTVAMWKEYCAETGNAMPDAPPWGWLDDHPMVNVSWYDIVGSGSNGYVPWASKVAGMQLTLPTEAQWEYAARGGLEGREYPWGNDFDDSKVWCSFGGGRQGTAPVSRGYNAYRNGYGLTDMAGNVWQWCLDWYGDYAPGEALNPTGPDAGNWKVFRGGSFLYQSVAFRCACRYGGTPGGRDSDVGFRLAAPGP